MWNALMYISCWKIKTVKYQLLKLQVNLPCDECTIRGAFTNSKNHVHLPMFWKIMPVLVRLPPADWYIGQTKGEKSRHGDPSIVMSLELTIRPFSVQSYCHRHSSSVSSHCHPSLCWEKFKVVCLSVLHPPMQKPRPQREGNNDISPMMFLLRSCRSVANCWHQCWSTLYAALLWSAGQRSGQPVHNDTMLIQTERCKMKTSVTMLSFFTLHYGQRLDKLPLCCLIHSVALVIFWDNVFTMCWGMACFGVAWLLNLLWQVTEVMKTLW